MDFSHISFTYCSVHFKTCPLAFRELWSALADPALVQPYLLRVLQTDVEFVAIGTCNRFDLCLFGHFPAEIIWQLFHELASLSPKAVHNSALTPEQVSHFVRIERDEKALWRLCRVTAGLDSLVLGEQQIFAQMKDAYQHCVSLGFARYRAHDVFGFAFRVAKRVRHDTGIGKNSLSVGYIAVEIISQVFASYADKKILIVGSGRMAKIVAQNFLSKGVRSLHLASRTYQNADRLAGVLQGVYASLSCTVHTLPQALASLGQYDICVMACAGNDLIITPAYTKTLRRQRKGDLTVFIDISVPRKITETIQQVDNFFLFDIDKLELITEKNRSLREESAQKADALIEIELAKYLAALNKRQQLAFVGKFHQFLVETIQSEVDRYFKKFHPTQAEIPSVIATAAAKKIVAKPALCVHQNQEVPVHALDVLFPQSPRQPLFLATRKSPLAMWQATTVQQILTEQGLEVSLKQVVTTGDIIQNHSLAQVQLGGSQPHLATGKGLFIKEIQEALLNKTAHFAVHSMKDLPAHSTPGIVVGALLPRAQPEDVLVLAAHVVESVRQSCPEFESLQHIPFDRLCRVLCAVPSFMVGPVGTSSQRRQDLLHMWVSSQLAVQPLRGNVDSRLQKLKQGQYKAIVLAKAGLQRLNLFDSACMYTLPPTVFVPSAAQGVVAVECVADNDALCRKLASFTCVHTCFIAAWERLILTLLEGGCHASIGIYCDGEQIFLFDHRDAGKTIRTIPISRENKDTMQRLWKESTGVYSLFFELVLDSSLASSMLHCLQQWHLT